MAAVFGDASVYRVHLPNFRSSTGIWSKSWCWAELCWVGLGRVVLGPGSLSVFWLSFCFFLIDFLDHSYQVRVVSSRFGDARMCWMSPAQCDLLFVAWVLVMVWDFNLCLCACPQKWREFRAHGVSYGHLPSIIRALDGSWRCAWLAASLSRLVYEDSTTKVEWHRLACLYHWLMRVILVALRTVVYIFVVAFFRFADFCVFT